MNRGELEKIARERLAKSAYPEDWKEEMLIPIMADFTLSVTASQTAEISRLRTIIIDGIKATAEQIARACVNAHKEYESAKISK